jgi:conjugal transfer ATP-binding protein TraC
METRARRRSWTTSTVPVLLKFPDYARDGDSHATIGGFSEDLAATAHRLAFNMREFARGGKYEAFFNGRSPFDIHSDEFVVLELGKLEQQRSLFQRRGPPGDQPR